LNHRQLRQLQRALRERVDGEVRFEPGTRAAYSTDGSNFRQLPVGVMPRPDRSASACWPLPGGLVSLAW
jgi:hypothetical protein